MLPEADAVFKAFVALFFFSVPAFSLHLLVRGLANPRAEAWDVTDGAASMKAHYRAWARFGGRVNLFVFALFLVQLLNLLVVNAAGCDPNQSHLSAAAWNIIGFVDRAALVAFIALGVLGAAGIVWAATYLYHAHQAKWEDPRRKDGLIVHLALVPLAFILMVIAFGTAKRMVCPHVIGIG